MSIKAYECAERFKSKNEQLLDRCTQICYYLPTQEWSGIVSLLQTGKMVPFIADLLTCIRVSWVTDLLKGILCVFTPGIFVAVQRESMEPAFAGIAIYISTNVGGLAGLITRVLLPDLERGLMSQFFGFKAVRN